MNFPLISEYVEAVKMAEDNFDELCHLRPVLDKDGQPVMSSGNFAVVFKMRNTESGKFHAVRCFHREQEGRTESYRQIEEALRQVQSPYLVSFRYMDKELFVDSKQTGGETEFPVLLMDWVEGVTLDRYIREHINDKDALEVLAYRFSLMASWLIAQPFAHGDLKPDNILVRPDGTITLVDYDGMFVPSMQGQSARELGSPDFRHPLRTEADFDGSIDDFPLVSILLSLKAIAVNPSLLDQFGASDRLLFSEADYRDISKCKVLLEIFPSADNELNKVISLFTLALTDRKFVGVSPNLLELAEPAYLAYEKLSTEVTDEDLAEAIEDEFGVKYSKDGKRLLKGDDVNIKKYTVRKGTIIICDEAFRTTIHSLGILTEIYIPNSITKIGNSTFKGCRNLKSIHIPESVIEIGQNAFSWCDKVEQITVHPFNPYYDSRENSNAIICDNTLIVGCQNTHIPNSVTEIGEYAFLGCQSITNISIPCSISKIGTAAFSYCDSLISIYIPKSVTKIEEEAFSWCSSLTNINLPDSIIEIKKSVFWGCRNLNNIRVPQNVTKVGDLAFWGCENLTDIYFPENMTEIGGNTFWNCKKLATIHLSKNVTKIGHGAFRECENLTNIYIPNSVKEIGVGAFYGCKSMKNIQLPKSLTTIEERVFEECENLTDICIPEGVVEIGASAFLWCKSITNIHIPKSVTKIGKYAFSGCKNIVSIHIPENVIKIEETAFVECCNLEKITVQSSNSHFDSRENCNAVICTEAEKTTLILGCKCTYIPESVTEIGEHAFCGCKNMSQIYIPSNIVKIKNYAFSSCESLTNINIPESIIEIGEHAFYGCKNLTCIQIPNGVIKIGGWAFRSSGLTNISIPNSVVEIGETIFLDCPYLHMIKIPLGTKEKFTKLLPNYKHLLVER